MEQDVYHHMGMCSSTYGFQWSHWNSGCGRDQIVMRVSECLLPEQRTQLRNKPDPDTVS